MSEDGLFQSPERLAIILVFLVIFAIITFFRAKAKTDDASKAIGNVKCNRCGHRAKAKAQANYMLVKGVSTKLTCERCGSEDWRRCGRNPP